MENKKLTALFFAFTLFFFGPLEIYFSVYEEVWFGIEHIAGLVLLLFVSGFAGMLLLLTAIGKWMKKSASYLGALIFGLVCAAYLQGNFLPSSFGSMDGEAVDWSSFVFETILSVGVWLAILLLVLFLRYKTGNERFAAASRVVMICILLVQAVTLGTLCLTTEGLKSKDAAAFSDKNEFDYSSEENIAILVLDMYDSGVFQAILEESGNEKYMEALDGFTYYPDTVGAYGATNCAIPQLLTGKGYQKGEQWEEYLAEAYNDAPFLHALREREYDINIYTNEVIPSQQAEALSVSNYLSKEEAKVEVSSKTKMLELLGKLVGIRYLPQPLKRYCWFYTAEFWDIRDVPYENSLYSLENAKFNGRIDSLNTDAENKTFHFYHVEGTHAPCYYNENFEKTDIDLSQEGREGMLQNGKGLLVVVGRFLEKLQEEGIYDKTAIVIMADHGGRFSGEYVVEQYDRANPLFLVKGFGERHPLAVSAAAVSYEDLQTGFLKLLDGEKGEKILPEEAFTENRKRCFTNTVNFQSYVTEGKADDLQGFQALDGAE